MRRFSVRDLFWLTLVVALGVGWWVDRRAIEARHDEVFSSLNSQVIADLYTDAEVRRLAPFDIEAIAGDEFLDVVPTGAAYPRGSVFKTLGIEDGRLRDFREGGIMHVVYLEWQVSPSYDISCMTAVNDPDNDGLQMTDPRRKVYGIRLLKRSELALRPSSNVDSGP